MSTPTPEPSWAQRRREAAQARAEALRASQRAESAHARALIADFLREARALDIPSRTLTVTGYGGRGRAKTSLRGWLLRSDGTIALAEDGELYVLTAPLTWRERIGGIALTPMRPVLVLGSGGKDGESMDLREALARVLRRE